MTTPNQRSFFPDRGQFMGLAVNTWLLLLLLFAVMIILGRSWIVGDVNQQMAQADAAAQVQYKTELKDAKMQQAATAAQLEGGLEGQAGRIAELETQVAMLAGQLEQLNAKVEAAAQAVPTVAYAPHNQAAYAQLAAAGLGETASSVDVAQGQDRPALVQAPADYKQFDQAAYGALSAQGVNWKATYVAPSAQQVAQAAVVADSTPVAPKPEPEAKPEPVVAVVSGPDVAAGKKLFKRCAACHTVNEGGKAKTGPNLWGIVGAQQAGAEKFKYSSAFKALDGVWDEAALDAFLESPKGYAKGTKMNFRGLSKPQERVNLIGYLGTLK